MIRDQGKDIPCCRKAKASSDLSGYKTKTKSALKSSIHERVRLATVLTGEYGRKDGQDRVTAWVVWEEISKVVVILL